MMDVPIRGNEETLIADGTALGAGVEIGFEWDLTTSIYGGLTVEVEFPASGFGDIFIYACSTEINAPALTDYPMRVPPTGRQVGMIPAVASTVVPVTCYAGQGQQYIRIYNSGTAGAVISRCRGRKYS